MRARPDLEPFFLNLLAHSEAWRERGHELASFLVPQVRTDYEHWLLARIRAGESGSDVEGVTGEESARVRQPQTATRHSRSVAAAIFLRLQGEALADQGRPDTQGQAVP